jgi:leader peptidase (prepilin peptidase) / N-methyltransferase
MTGVLVVTCAVLGLAIGAALEIVIERVPDHRPLRGWSLAELRRGRAALVAVACGALFGGLAARYHDTWVLPAYLLLAAALLALSVIDLEHFLLPNRIVYPLAIALPLLLALAVVADGDGWERLGRAALAGLAALGVMGVLHVISPRSMGFGDVKLAFVLGLALGWLGWGEVVLGLFLGFLAGGVMGLALVMTRLRSRKDHIPFGPFLALGTLTVLLWGEAILHWYRHT